MLWIGCIILGRRAVTKHQAERHCDRDERKHNGGRGNADRADTGISNEDLIDIEKRVLRGEKIRW